MNFSNLNKFGTGKMPEPLSDEPPTITKEIYLCR